MCWGGVTGVIIIMGVCLSSLHHYAVTACLFHFVLLVKGHQVPFLCFLESFSFCQRSCGSGVFRVEEGDE